MTTRPTLPVLSDTHASLSETLAVLEQRERLRRHGFLLGSLAGAATIAALPLRSIACSLIPTETAGPYPGDGTNGPNALTQSGIVRSDIRSSFGASGTAKRRGHPAHDDAAARQHSLELRADQRSLPSICGIATPAAAIRCIPRASPDRTICAACK